MAKVHASNNRDYRNWPENPSSDSPISASGLGSWVNHLKVGQKIALGYGLALSLAVSGTTLGFMIADRYQQKAYTQQEEALTHLYLAYRLQVGVFRVRTKQHKLILFTNQRQRREETYSQLLTHVTNARQIWSEFQSTYASLPPKVNQSASEIKAINRLLQTDDGFDAYLQRTEVLFQKSNPRNLKSEEMEAAKTELFQFMHGSSVFKLDDFLNDLTHLVEVTAQEYEQSKRNLRGAERLRVQIIASSLMLSVAVATLLVIYMYQAIARPIQSVTYVAQQVTQESNFDLQASVTNHDEVGILADSLNRLIREVQQLLKTQTETNEQLEIYNHILEQKVQERTKELREKNQFLQKTINELHQTQAQLVQTEKMSSLGQIVAGVAHEINNPVNFIGANLTYIHQYTQQLLELLELYQQQYPSSTETIQEKISEIELDFLTEDIPQILTSMKTGYERITEIVVSLRTFSRFDAAKTKAVDIHEGIDSTLMILQHRLKDKPEHPGIEVVRDYGQLPLIECYSGQLSQVFMNILSNAIDALDAYNTQRTKEEVAINPSQIQIHTEVLENQWAVIHIADNGPGISEQVQRKIFDPFFTTKPLGKGTGLGLSISYQIVVEKHSGELQCYSAPGQGTEFVIRIPVVKERSRRQ
ncbi:MAG TPA: histidine kinase [Cyanobacteria bacterium UBA8553]|nr:histidine kinase [Cyanobacteria bacterium UBA8553]